MITDVIRKAEAWFSMRMFYLNNDKKYFASFESQEMCVTTEVKALGLIALQCGPNRYTVVSCSVLIKKFMIKYPKLQIESLISYGLYRNFILFFAPKED